MSTPGVPAWGCPWHGLVKNERLQLPNGEEMYFPQPAGSAWQGGMALLLQRPGMPEIEATELDQAEGRVWRNWAILSGARNLHGKQLPGDGWIYIDPEGDRWLVTTTLSTSVSSGLSSFQITLQRFGVLGGQPVEYVREVPMPDIQQTDPVIGGLTGLAAAVFDTRPDGSAAIFMVFTRWTDAAGNYRQDDYVGDTPMGWLEIKLSGAGDEIEATIELLKSRAQTLGVLTDAVLSDQLQPYRYVETTDVEFPAPDTRVFTSTYNLEPAAEGDSWDIAYRQYSGTAARRVAGYVLAMWYREGAISELTLTVSEIVAASSLTPDIAPGSNKETYVDGELVDREYTEFKVAWSGSTSSSTSIVLAIDGQGVSSKSLEYEAETTIEITRQLGSGLTEGGNISSTSEGVSESDSYERPFEMPAIVGQSVIYQANIPGSWANYLSYVAGPPTTLGGRNRYSVLRASQAAFGLMRYPPTTGSPVINLPLVTPHGPAFASIPATGSGGYGRPPLYASLDPVSKQLAVDTVPICFT